jgi:hypothetical protein
MSRRFRTFLLMLLLAAVPLRGYAAASMLLCADRHGAPAQVMQDHHAVAGHEVSGHEHHQMPADDAHAAVAAHDHGQPASSVCAICGDCCSAQAVSFIPSAVPGMQISSQAAGHPAAPLASHIADLPVPPPNRFAA